MLKRLQIERPRLEQVLRLRCALFFWLLPAVSIIGVLANIIYLTFCICRRVRRKRTALQSTPNNQLVLQHISSASTPTRKASSSDRECDFGPGPHQTTSSHSESDLRANAPQRGHVFLMIPSEHSGIHSECGSPSPKNEQEPSKQPPPEGRSACAMQLELYVISSVLLLSLASIESLCVSQFHTHPSLLHGALCRLWPLIYHMLLTFSPAILIFPLLHKCMLLKYPKYISIR